MSRRNLPITPFTPEELELLFDEEREEVLSLEKEAMELESDGAKEEDLKELKQHLDEFRNIAQANKAAGKDPVARFDRMLSELFKNNMDMNYRYPNDKRLPNSLADGDYDVLLGLLKKDKVLKPDLNLANLRWHIDTYVARKQLKQLVYSETLEEEVAAVEDSIPLTERNNTAVKFNPAVERRTEVRLYNEEGNESDELPEIESVLEDDNEFKPSDKNKFVGVRTKDEFEGIAGEKESSELKQRIASAQSARAVRVPVELKSILKKPKDMTKPVPQPYVLTQGAQTYVMRVLADPNKPEYLMPNIMTMGQYDVLMSDDAPTVTDAEGLYYEPDGEGPKNISAAAALLRDRGGDGYLTARLDMNAAKVNEELKRTIESLGEKEAKIAIALEWSCLHALIMQSQEEITVNANRIKELKIKHATISMPSLTSPTGSAADSKTLVVEGSDGNYVTLLDPKNNSDLIKAQNDYKNNVEPLNEEIRNLEGRNAEIIKNIAILKEQSRAHQEKLKILDPQAFTGVEVADSPVYLSFAEGNDAPPLSPGGAKREASSVAAKVIVPSAPPLREASSTAVFSWDDLPGSTENKKFQLDLSFIGSADGDDVGNPLQLKFSKTQYNQNEAENYIVEQANLEEYKQALMSAFPEKVLPTLFEPKANNGSVVLSEGRYETPAAFYDFDPLKAAEKINELDNAINKNAAKATFAAYLLDLNAHIETALAEKNASKQASSGVYTGSLIYEARAEVEEDAGEAAMEAAENTDIKGEAKQKLDNLYQTLGVLTAAMKTVLGKELVTRQDQVSGFAPQKPADASSRAIPSAAVPANAAAPEAPSQAPSVSAASEAPSQAPSVSAAPEAPSQAPSVSAAPEAPSQAPSVSAASEAPSLAPSAPAVSEAAAPAAPSLAAAPSAIPSVSAQSSQAPSSDFDKQSLTPSRITNFRPKVSAQRELPPEVAGEKYFTKELTDNARNHATEMAYLAVNKPAEAKKEIGNYISQNYEGLLKCRILAPYTAKINNFDPNNSAHKKTVIESASSEISQFVELCKTYDPANADSKFNAFREKIGLVKDTANSSQHKIIWVANDAVSDKPVGNKQGDITKEEQFFWQRTFLAAQRAEVVKEAGVSPTVEKDKGAEMVRRAKIKEKLLDRNRSEDPQNDADNAGLAKTGDGVLLTAEGIAKHMAFYEAQDSQSAAQDAGFDIFNYLSYSDFAELSGRLAAIKAEGIDDIDEANEAIIKAGIEDLFGGYFEFGGDSRTDVRSRSLLPMLWMLREHTAQADKDGEIFSKKFAKQKKIANDSTKTQQQRDDAIAAMKKIAQDLFNDLISKSAAELDDLYKEAKEGVKDKVLFEFGDDEALDLYKKLSEEKDEDAFDEAKKRLKKRRAQTPPNASEVLAARKRIAEALSAMPGQWQKDNKGNVANKVPLPPATLPKLKDNPNEQERTEYDTKKVAYDAAMAAHKTEVAKYYASLPSMEYAFKDLAKFDPSNFEVTKTIADNELQTYLNNGQNAAGDENLFGSPAKPTATLRSGFLIAEFNKESCLYDLAKAVNEMPSSALRSQIEKGKTVHSLAYLSGDDGFERKNRHVLISQSNRGTIATFMNKEVAEQELFAKNAQFYEENHQHEARIDSLQQAADLSLVALQNNIAAEFRRKDSNGNSVYADMEAVMKSAKIIDLTNYNKDLNALLREFGSNENDSVEKRKGKMSRLKDFVSSDQPNLNPPFLTSNAKSLSDILSGLAANMPDNSTAAKKFLSLKSDIINPSHTNAKIEAEARKYSQAEMQNHLDEKTRTAKIESELRSRLDGEDIEVIEKDYYRLNNIRPDFTKGGKSDLEKLLSSEIPSSPVSGITIFKPKPGEPGYVRYKDSAKNPPGKANTAIININIPSDPVLAAQMDYICWVHLPGSPECYIKVSVDVETGKTTIHEEVYHRNKEGYNSIGPSNKSITAALGPIIGPEVCKLRDKFSVLAVSSIGGVRSGVSAKFDGNIINKTQQEIKSKAITAASLRNPSSLSRNLGCTFAIDNKKRIMPDGPSLKLLQPLTNDAAIVKSPYIVSGAGGSEYVKNHISLRNFTINGKDIEGKGVTGIKFVYGVDLPDEAGGIKLYSKKSMRFDPPKVVLTYKNANGGEDSLIFDANHENMKTMLGRDPLPGFQNLLAKAKNDKLNGTEVLAAKSATLVEGVDLPKSFGDMKDGIDENKVRIVLPVMAIKGDQKDKIGFSTPVIEYYMHNSGDPLYMPFTPDNLQTLYKNELLPSTVANLAARVDVQVANSRIPAVFQRVDKDGKIIEEVEIPIQGSLDIDKPFAIDLDKNGRVPSSTCAVISAEMIKGQQQEPKSPKKGGNGASI